MKGSKRRSPLAGELIGKEVSKLLINFKAKRVGLSVKGKFTRVVRGVFRGLLTRSRTKFLFVAESKGVAHNGVRLRKKRRL